MTKIFDQKIINPKYGVGSSQVKYALYRDDNPIKKLIRIPKDLASVSKLDKSGKKFGWNVHPCFSVIGRQLKEGKSYNRILYKVEHFVKNTGYGGLYTGGGYEYPTLTDDECVEWVKLAKKNKMLPNYVPQSCGINRVISIYLDPKIPIALLYVYLATFRYIREYAGFVRAVLYLVNDLGMNFYTAFILGSVSCVGATGHHILSVSRYMVTGNNGGRVAPNPDTVMVPLDTAVRLKRFVQDPQKYDKRRLDKNSSYISWNCSGTINQISVPTAIQSSIPGAHLLHPAIQKLMLVDNDNDIKAQFAVYKKDDKINEWLKNYKKAD